MSSRFDELAIEHALAALERQARFDAWLGQHAWEWDRDCGHLTLRRREADGALGTAVTLASQALGSVSRMSETWTWIWANELAEVSDNLMEAALRLLALGEEHGIPEFTTGEFARAECDAHLLSLVAMGVLNADAYFRGSYLGGEGFVLVNESELRDVLPRTPARLDEVIRVVREVDAVSAEHRRAIAAYLRRSGWLCHEDGDVLEAHREAERFEVIFANGRFVDVNEIQKEN